MKKKLFLPFLSFILIVGVFCFPISAANYSSDYRYWSQGASSYTNMNKYGCWVVAQAKLIYEANIDRSSSFNPDKYMSWEQENGYLNSGFYQVNGGYAPEAYAKQKGKSLIYQGKTTSSVENKIWDNISKGYWTLICVLTSSGSEHYVMIANDLSKTNGELYCYNSYTGYNSASPSTISARKYKITDVYTYSSVGNVSISAGWSGANDTITETNAVVYGTVSKPSSYTASKFGIFVRRSNGTYTDGWSLMHKSSSAYSGTSKIKIWYDFNDELGLTLTHATSYTYKLYAVVDGAEYYSSEATFTTSGSHSYGAWQTITSPSCTSNGSKKRTCSCGAVETQTVAALGHNYSSSYTVDTEPTCTTAGSKSKHCTRCSSKTSVLAIPATGHLWSEWNVTKSATVKAAGLKERKCTNKGCSAKETAVIAKLSSDGHTHNFGEWFTETVPTCVSNGVRKRVCSECKVYETSTISAKGHSFGEWVVEKPPTCTENGLQKRACTTCSETETADLSTSEHIWSEWEAKKNGSYERCCTVCSEIEVRTADITDSSAEDSSIAASDLEVIDKDKLGVSAESLKPQLVTIALIAIAITLFCLLFVIFVVFLFKKKKRK